MNFLSGKLTRFVRPLLFILMLTVASASFAGVFVSVTVGPPPLPVYVQPPCPEPGFLWIPGYWAWGPFGYYWVPGYWAAPPALGLYWTPGYWGWDPYEAAFLWHGGYWGPQVGFYGGINYGFGYFGVGFVGGEWRGDRFYYNRAVVNINQTRITNVYVNKTVIVNRQVNYVSYNGGTGGIQRQPTQRELVAQRERHVEATALQTRHIQKAEQNPQFRARNNGGRPQIAATARPADFSSRNVVPARATGGRVDTAVLNATPKNMPAPRGPERGMAPGGATAPGAARGGTMGGRPETGGGRPSTLGTETARPETGRSRPMTEERRGGPPERTETGGGRPSGGRPETARPETGAARPSGRPDATRPETGSSRPMTEERRGGPPARTETGGGRPSGGRPETARPETGGNRPSAGERRGGPPERSAAPPRNEQQMRPERERPGATAAPQERSMRQPTREAPSRGKAPQRPEPEEKEHGGGHGR
jgi:YXWGXW repeat-containing protein